MPGPTQYEEVDPDRLEDALHTLARWIANEHRRRLSGRGSARPDQSLGRTTTTFDGLNENPRLLDVDALAHYLSVPKATVYSWAFTRKILEMAIVRLGRTLKFDRCQIDDWVNRNRSEPIKTRT